MVMIIQILLLKSSPFLLGNGRGDGHDHTEPSSEKLSFSFGKSMTAIMVIQSLLLRISPPLLGKGRGGDHGHAEPSFEKRRRLVKS